MSSRSFNIIFNRHTSENTKQKHQLCLLARKNPRKTFEALLFSIWKRVRCGIYHNQRYQRHACDFSPLLVKQSSLKEAEICFSIYYELCVTMETFHKLKLIYISPFISYRKNNSFHSGFKRILHLKLWPRDLRLTTRWTYTITCYKFMQGWGWQNDRGLFGRLQV